MKQRPVFEFTFTCLVGAVCLMDEGEILVTSEGIAAVLLITCLMAARLLTQVYGKWVKAGSVLCLLALLLTVFTFGKSMFPFGLALTFQAFKSALWTLAGGFILGLVIAPDTQSFLWSVVVFVSLFFVSTQFDRLLRMNQKFSDYSEEISLLRDRLDSQRKLLSTLEKANRSSERNRISVRIHDEVGHGISGSVILLEGALSIFDKNPEKAKQTVALAATNLRESVDDIRATLRDERPMASEMGKSEVAAVLTGFEVLHPQIQTELITQGEMEDISLLIWITVTENLKEALTNTLKHSNATRFSVHILIKNKLITVKLSDNGDAKSFKAGIGLCAMEERTALRGGRVFFDTTDGFNIVMTFTKNWGEDEEY